MALWPLGLVAFFQCTSISSLISGVHLPRGQLHPRQHADLLHRLGKPRQREPEGAAVHHQHHRTPPGAVIHNVGQQELLADRVQGRNKLAAKKLYCKLA